jgi:hypothetical protein
MECKELKEEFVGIFDFEKEEMISGKGNFSWKDKNNNNWTCEGLFTFYIFY